MDHVDLCSIHWPPRARALVPTWEALLAARDQGLARAVGVSNYSLALLDELVDATGQASQVNQIPWAPSPCTTPPCSTGTAGAASSWRAVRSRTPTCVTPCWPGSPPATG